MGVFSFLSKRGRRDKMLNELDSLQNTAQLAVLLVLKEEFRGRMDERQATRLAAAVVNEIFGNEISEVSAAHLDMDEVQRCASELLQDKLDTREIVVQSLRIRSYVHFGRHACLPSTFSRYQAILKQYGAEFPETPKPEAYRRLVHRTVRSLPPHILDLIKSERFWT